MKHLSLFVDKWFIAVAVNIDGNVRPLRLPNGEDRIWLFFHENTAAHHVDYGKSFEANYRDREPHYIGDVFPLIASGTSTLNRYDNRPEEMKEIFRLSSIFSHLHQAVEDDGKVDTYISFSSDIPDVARLKFIEELKESGFEVVESVARISHLALEESKKRGVFTEEGYYLALVATNDNLHYALYNYTEGFFIRKNELTLDGYGLDVRRRALVEEVVENVNRTTHFLSSPEEISQEYMRQDRFADDWLNQIANRRFKNLPITFPDVTFAVAPNNPYPVTILPSKLDERTECIVDDVVRKICDFVRENDVQSYEIKGVVFVGNTFTNEKFTMALNNRIILEQDKIVLYRDVELPKVVSVYSQIDCGQFKGATDRFMQDAKNQELLNKQAQEEEERRRAAEEEARKRQETIDKQRKAEQDYSSAIECMERFESDHDYEQMRDWAEIALSHKSDDEYAAGKLTLAQQLIAEQKAANKQYSAVLQRAKIAFEEKRWSDVISQCESALELRPDSADAKQMKSEARRKLEMKEKVMNFLNRADVFYAQKLYKEALDEVGKVLNLDAKNDDALQLRKKITEVFERQDTVIKALCADLDEAESRKDFDKAITACDSLISEDPANLPRWMEKKEKLKSEKRELEQNRQRLLDMKGEINTANFEDDWNKLIYLCDSYLSVETDEEILALRKKASLRIEEQKEKVEKEKEKVEKENAIKHIIALIAEMKYNEAEAELRCFENKYPAEKPKVKDLRKRLFQLESDSERPIQEPRNTSGPIGFTFDNTDDFWEDGKSTGQRKESKTAKQSSVPKKKDDFFDQIGSKKKEEQRNYSIDDFNF
jgi:protein involved in ribonucleotide reduction